MKFRLPAGFIVISCLTLLSNATIAPPDKNKKTKPVKEFKINKGPVDKNVFERNLIQDEPTSESIIKQSGTYYKNTSARLFEGPTLGFVTPVNILFCCNFYYSLCSFLIFFFNFIKMLNLKIQLHFFLLLCVHTR